MAKKTKEELEKELELTIAEAKARYNSIVKPAQEKYKLKEQQARILFEQTTKLLNGLSLVSPGQYNPMYEKVKQIIGFTEIKSPITGKVAQTPSGIIYLESDEVQQYQKAIGAAEDAYRNVVADAMSDYGKGSRGSIRS